MATVATPSPTENPKATTSDVTRSHPGSRRARDAGRDHHVGLCGARSQPRQRATGPPVVWIAPPRRAFPHRPRDVGYVDFGPTGPCREPQVRGQDL